MRYKWKLSEKDVSQIINLYKKEGVCQNQIAKQFRIDHSTVYYHLVKNGVELRTSVIRLKPQVRKVVTVISHTDFDGDKLNEGKSYQEYIEEDRKRQRKEMLQSIKSGKSTHICMRVIA